jgi:hypothetical protein
MQPLAGSRKIGYNSWSNNSCNSHSIKGDAQFSCTEPSVPGGCTPVTKIQLQNESLRGRKRRKLAILTDTREKKAGGEEMRYSGKRKNKES